MMNKTKTLDAETIAQAAERASTAASTNTMKSIPKTVAGLERDYHQLRNDSSHVYQYLKNIPLKTVETLFKRSEVQAELLAGVLEALTTHGLGDADSSKHSAELLLSLSKSDNYEMTLMFIDDAEKTKMKKIGDAIKKHKDVYNRYNKVYGSL